MPRSSMWSLPVRFSDQHFACISHLTHVHYMPHPSHPLGLITIIFVEEYKLWSSYSLLEICMFSSPVWVEASKGR
jgi:hypothetical protein